MFIERHLLSVLQNSQSGACVDKLIIIMPFYIKGA